MSIMTKLLRMNEKANKQNAEILMTRQITKHIFVVLCHKERQGEYVTWIYNSDSDGFYSGNYFSYVFYEQDEMYKEATQDYFERK